MLDVFIILPIFFKYVPLSKLAENLKYRVLIDFSQIPGMHAFFLKMANN